MDLLDKITMFTFNGEYTVEGDKAEYDAFVKAKLAKSGKSLGDMDDEETKEFFAMIDKEWKGEETNENYEEEDEEEQMKNKKKDVEDGET